MKKDNFDPNYVFIVICAIFCAVLQCFQPYFIYQADLLISQPWRWWTGHWVHVGWIHYILNILVLACLPFLFPKIKIKVFVVLLFILPPCSSVIFYKWYPQIYAYAGLSGILHGLFIFSAIVNLKEKSEQKFSLIILALIFSKIIWEHYFGALQTEKLIGHPVLTQAHLVGTALGILGAAMCLILKLDVFKNRSLSN